MAINMDKQMTPEHIHSSDPRCSEIQNGHSDYHDGILLADSHFEDTDGEWLVGPFDSFYGKTYANVHWLHWLPKVDGKRVYGIRMWTKLAEDRMEPGY